MNHRVFVPPPIYGKYVIFFYYCHTRASVLQGATVSFRTRLLGCSVIERWPLDDMYHTYIYHAQTFAHIHTHIHTTHTRIHTHTHSYTFIPHTHGHAHTHSYTFIPHTHFSSPHPKKREKKIIYVSWSFPPIMVSIIHKVGKEGTTPLLRNRLFQAQ